MNFKQLLARRSKMAERAAALMELHFPSYPASWLWTRKSNHGFTTVPRTLPIAMQAVDQRAKGQPPGHVLFCLWARSPDHPLIVIENPATFAAEAGFTGRAVDTWRRRMRTLQEHCFLTSKKGSSGEFHYVLLHNPNAAVEWMRTHGFVQDELYGRFLERMAEIGAINDLQQVREYWAAQSAAAAAAAAAMQVQEITPATPETAS